MSNIFDSFFENEARNFMLQAIDIALNEDGDDLTTNAIFSPSELMNAYIISKEPTFITGLPMFPLILERTAELVGGEWELKTLATEGTRVTAGVKIAAMHGSARILLRAERILLNFLSHLSGISNLVNIFVKSLSGTGVHLLDTRKTLPCLRYLEKYAVIVGGGRNHRKNLAELLMIKDNHIDAIGSIQLAVSKLRDAYGNDVLIEVECRTKSDVDAAVSCNVKRIMLDNMGIDELKNVLPIIPLNIEVEISGGVSLETIRHLATSSDIRRPDYISVGRVTNSAPAADFSMYFSNVT